MSFCRLKGPLCILGAAFCFSLGGLLIRLLPFSPLAISGARGAVAALFTLAVRREPLHINGSTAAGALSVCLTGILYTGATRYAGAGAAITLQYTSVAFVVLFSFLLFGERPKKADLAACAAVLCGVALVFSGSFAAAGAFGCLLGLASGASYSLVFLCGRFKGADAASAYLLGEALCGAVGLPFFFAERTLVDLHTIEILLVLGVFQMGLSYLLLLKGLKTTPPLTASLLACAEPVLNPLWAALFLGERMAPSAVCGGALVVLSSLFRGLLHKKALGAKQPPTKHTL